MSENERFDRLARIFETARELPFDDRVAYLDQSCQDDPALRAEVEALISEHATGGVLDDPARLPVVDADAPAPRTIGRYTVGACIGRGGMGAVYRAEQDHPKRIVAVKVMRAGLMSRDALRRFEFEAAVLGRLQHPGIAQIYDAGTADDGDGARPYFAMELVDGKRLDRHVESAQPDAETRLRLFSAICDAVHHAHQKGVIHRDLKPANILVTADGQPKILDFGVARPADAGVQATAQTATGQLVGTIAYMSPEQIENASESLDTRSDVYALGVILYEMMTGRLPYDLRGLSVAGAARVVSEADPAPLATTSRAYRGDLSTIVATALRKSPAERYQSAAGLGADVRRFLDHEPIQARPATTIYQIGKFARRHRGLVGGVVAAFLVLVLGIVGIAWQSAEVAQQSRLVLNESNTRRDVAGFLREILTSLDPAKTAGVPLTVRDMLDDAAARLEGQFENAPRVRYDLHNTVGQTYVQLGAYEPAETHLRLAWNGFRQEFGFEHEQTLSTLVTLTTALRQLDRLEETEAIIVDTLGQLEDPESAGAYALRENHAMVVDALGRTEEAEVIYRETYERALDRIGPDHRHTIFAQGNYAKSLLDLGRHEEAAPLFSGCLDWYRGTVGDDHPDTLLAMANLAAARGRLGDLEGAAALMREAADRSERVLGPHHLLTLRRRTNVTRTAIQRQELDVALSDAQRLLDVCHDGLGVTHSETLAAVELLVTATAFAESLEAAETVALDWYDRVEVEVGPTHRDTGRMALLLYNVYDSWEDPDEKAADKAAWLERVRASDYQVPAYLQPEAGGS